MRSFGPLNTPKTLRLSLKDRFIAAVLGRKHIVPFHSLSTIFGVHPGTFNNGVQATVKALATALYIFMSLSCNGKALNNMPNYF